ncbi:MAG TPA: protoglobin domain-containing protein [Pirellulaceae bacterium]|nr:protoglobin domain-containing protein [Pirellulaceae bacterium]
MTGSPQAVFARYQDLQSYVAWTDKDLGAVDLAGKVLAPHLDVLIDDFYAEIERHPAASRVITGGQEQIARLRKSLRGWLNELFAGPYDGQYVARRWRVGQRHVEIGLPQVYAAAALSRLRNGMIRLLRKHWSADEAKLAASLQSLNKLLDLDLAIISDAYETEYVHLKQEAERRRLAAVLHQEKELAAGLLAHAQVAVLILDWRGRIVRCNAFFERLVGSSQAEVQDKDWFELFLREEDRARIRSALVQSSGTDSAEPVAVTSSLQCTGRLRHLYWSGVPLHDAAGLPFAVLVIGHDVTDLLEAQQRALQSERLAAIGQMATGLAHESRSALQRIGASAEMLEMDLEGNEKALQLVRRIQNSQAHLHHLLEEVRSYAAPVVLDRSECRISEVWREAWELLSAQRHMRQVTFSEQITAEKLVIEGDRFRLVQVFRNVLENALAACQEPAHIEVVCEAATLGHSPAVRVSIRDNGPGLNAEQRRRIFEPFYTTKPSGTGLGMAIVQRIIEAHGGTIALGDNSPGAEIIITLPRRDH